MRRVLIAGTINHRVSDDSVEYVHLDISPRDIWHPEEGAVPVDIVADLADGLPMFESDTFDEVIAHHVLEHLTREGGRRAMAAIFRVLKPGGLFDVEVPDMDRICEAWLAETFSRHDLQQWIYGENLPNHEAGDSHRFGYWEDEMRVTLEAIGFRVGRREETGLALRFRAVKPR